MAEIRRIDEHLQEINSLCEQWADQAWDWKRGRSHPIWRAMHLRECAATPDTGPGIAGNVMTLDRILAESDGLYKAVIIEWYIRGGSVSQKAERLGTNRTDLYALWRRSLEYLRGRLHGQGVKI